MSGIVPATPGLGIDLSSPPFGSIGDLPVLLLTITAQAQQQPESDCIIVFEYSDSGLLERLHPARTELDDAARDHVVYIQHRFGHTGVANSRANRGKSPVSCKSGKR